MAFGDQIGEKAAATVAAAIPALESTITQTAQGLEGTAQAAVSSVQSTAAQAIAAFADGVTQLLNLGRAVDGATVTTNITITTTVKLAPESPAQ